MLMRDFDPPLREIRHLPPLPPSHPAFGRMLRNIADLTVSHGPSAAAIFAEGSLDGIRGILLQALAENSTMPASMEELGLSVEDFEAMERFLEHRISELRMSIA